MAIEEKIIKQFEPISISEGNQIIIKLKEFRNHEYLDIRIWYKPEDKDEYLPSPKGISVPLSDTLDNFDILVKSLVEAYCILHEETDFIYAIGKQND